MNNSVQPVKVDKLARVHDASLTALTRFEAVAAFVGGVSAAIGALRILRDSFAPSPTATKKD